MQIEHLELLAPDLAALRDFYAGRFGLPMLPSPDDRLILQVGTSLLAFVQAPNGWTGRYHFAFNIPENQYRQAKAWLTARVPLATTADGREDFHSTDWDADNLYYFDPAGNIGELIARHTLDCASATPFSSTSLLAISEIGLAAPDVPATVADLSSRLALSPYGESSDTFTPVGDEQGLFIVVRAGRIWYPDTGIAAVPLPLTVTVRNVQGQCYRVEATEAATSVHPLGSS